MAEEINARLVGTEFVRHYYTMLHERPDCLHLFFTQNSSYIHGGVEKPGDELPPIRGQAAIRDKIASFHFNDCRTKILQVDSQETIGNAVLVQVSGELSNNGEPMRRFMQSFVLVPQSPKKFYVHNDIFRYQDEVFADIENLSDDQCDGNNLNTGEAEDLTNRVAEEVDSSLPPVASEVLPENPIPTMPENVPTEPAPLMPEVAAQVSVVEDDAQSCTVTAAADDSAAVTHVEKEDHQETKKESEKELKELLPQVVPSPKPFSWASLASKPQAAIKPERKTESEPASVPAPLPQRAPRPAVINDGEKKWTSGPNEEPVSKRSNFPDNQQLFVGNLPHSVTDKELQVFFERFGTVVDVKINRKGSATNLPNFGFVAFENTEAVQKAMKEKPLMLDGKYRINIEEKKDHSELGGRPRINGRGRGGNYSRGGYVSRGGRGAGHATRPTSGGGPGAEIQQ